MSDRSIYLFATEFEAAPFRALRTDAECFVVGVGMAAAAAATARLIAQLHPRRIVLCGIAGACDEQLQVGDVVSIVRDSVVALPKPFRREYASAPVEGITPVGAYTVNATGESLPLLAEDNPLPMVEQMEGAAVAAVAEAFGVEYYHLRAISNRVSDERSMWRVGQAVEALAQCAAKIL